MGFGIELNLNILQNKDKESKKTWTWLKPTFLVLFFLNFPK